MNKLIVFVIGSILLTVFNIILVTILTSGTPIGIASKILGVGISFASIVLWIKLMEKYIQKPKELNIGLATENLLKSRTFWGAFIIFALSILRETTGVDVELDNESIRDMVLALDWTNVTQAVISVFVIMIKYFDIPKFINGILK